MDSHTAVKKQYRVLSFTICLISSEDKTETYFASILLTESLGKLLPPFLLPFHRGEDMMAGAGTAAWHHEEDLEWGPLQHRAQ